MTDDPDDFVVDEYVRARRELEEKEARANRRSVLYLALLVASLLFYFSYILR
jgi:fatty acid desaturase